MSMRDSVLKAIVLGVLATGCASPGAEVGSEAEPNAIAGSAAASDDAAAPARLAARTSREGDGIDRTHRLELGELAMVSSPHYSSQRLCDLVRAPTYAGFGLYRVDALTAFIEHFGEEEHSVTYAELSRLEDFHEAEPQLLVRLGGGPTSDGGLALWNVRLAVDEQVILLGLVPPVPQNHGYYGLNPERVFGLRAGGGFSNGQYFTGRAISAEALGSIVTAMRGAAPEDDCPHDEAPDLGLDHPVHEPEMHLIPVDDVDAVSDEAG